jgi:hypothetical protein
VSSAGQSDRGAFRGFGPLGTTGPDGCTQRHGAGRTRGAISAVGKPALDWHFPRDRGRAEKKELCFIYGQDSTAVVVDLDQGDKVPFTKLVITVEPWQSDPVVASIRAAAGLS